MLAICDFDFDFGRTFYAFYIRHKKKNTISICNFILDRHTQLNSVHRAYNTITSHRKNQCWPSYTSWLRLPSQQEQLICNIYEILQVAFFLPISTLITRIHLPWGSYYPNRIAVSQIVHLCFSAYLIRYMRWNMNTEEHKCTIWAIAFD